ncbi:MAG: CHASE2 domain-containing protein [Rhodospirillales bacterium]|nr:MAG: CHASE2 domain-containing protein [Rhodospirillales bacterium]
MRIIRRLRRWRRLPDLAVCLAVACLYLPGALDFIEVELADTRFELLGRAPSEDLLVVELDARSLHGLPVWPWPRRVYAEAIDRLNAAGAQRIAFDVDFSARSTARDDAALAAALRASSRPVVLPVFVQLASDGAHREDLVLSVPLPSLARHAALASVNLSPDADGRVRSAAASVTWGTTRLPSLFAALADPAEPVAGSFYIDYGIRASGIPRVSFIDILSGRFAPELVAGRHVMIGATAGQLSDDIPVPNYGVLPGVVVQALAFESYTSGRTLQRITQAPIILVTLLVALILGPKFRGWSWSRGVLTLAIFSTGAFCLSAGVQAALPVIIEVSPLLLAATLSYVHALTRRLDGQDLRLLTQGLAIRRKDAFMSQVVERSFDGILTFDRSGSIRTANRAAETIIGGSPGRAPGGDLNAILRDKSWQEADERPLNVCELRGGPHEMEIRGADGEVRDVQVVVSELPQDDEMLYIAHVRDVTRRNRAEATARAAQARLVEAIESVNEGFALYDDRDRLVLCNERFRALYFGSDQPILTGRPFEEIMRRALDSGRIAPAGRNADAWLARCLENHRNPRGSYEECIEDGVCVLVSEMRTLHGGTAAIYTEISEQKRQEGRLRDALTQAEAANRAKTEFLANMSHELRTPLNAIIGFSEMLASEYLGPIGSAKYAEYAEDIHVSGTHLLEIINNVLDVSKIEAGRLELNCEDIRVDSVTGIVRRLIEKRARDAGHDLVFDVPDGLPRLHADERSVKQVLLNLVSNAVKFTPDGGTISVRARLAADGRLMIDVTDNGIGIAPNDMPTALSAFGQVDSGLARRYEGTGLGLTLARRLMELHGGTLDLASEVRVGTTATIGFPADRLRRRERLPVSLNGARGRAQQSRAASGP